VFAGEEGGVFSTHPAFLSPPGNSRASLAPPQDHTLSRALQTTGDGDVRKPARWWAVVRGGTPPPRSGIGSRVRWGSRRRRSCRSYAQGGP